MKLGKDTVYVNVYERCLQKCERFHTHPLTGNHMYSPPIHKAHTIPQAHTQANLPCTILAPSGLLSSCPDVTALLLSIGLKTQTDRHTRLPPLPLLEPRVYVRVQP